MTGISSRYMPYPKYRPSGIDWLSNVPAHWDVKSLKSIVSFVNGAAFNPNEWQNSGIPIIRIQNLNGSEEFNYSIKEIPTKYHVGYGDLLFGWSGNRGTSFGPFLWHRHGLHYLNQHIFRVTNFNCDKLWLYWVLVGVTHYIERQAHGIIGMVHITSPKLGAIRIPYPETSQEQHAIANFLDCETAKIDSLIEKKQRLLDLLAERRQALISHVVTKGLNPHVPMKPSGIEWIGDIPTGWNVVVLKIIATFRYGDSVIKQDGDEDSIKVFGSNGAFGTHDKSNTLSPVIIIGRKGSYGKINWSTEAVFASDTTFFIDLTSTKQNLRWLFYVLKILKLDEGSRETAVPGLNREDAHSKIIPLPPLHEQYAIANYLDKKTAKIDCLIQKVEQAIELLKERRIALISEAVTGKINVSDGVQSYDISNLTA